MMVSGMSFYISHRLYRVHGHYSKRHEFLEAPEGENVGAFFLLWHIGDITGQHHQEASDRLESTSRFLRVWGFFLSYIQLVGLSLITSMTNSLVTLFFLLRENSTFWSLETMFDRPCVG